MSSSKSIGTFFFLLLLTVQYGCTTSSDKLAKLQTCFDDMKTVSSKFLEDLSTVNDEASAKAALPRLESTCEQMFAAGLLLDESAKTTLRTATGIKKEIEIYRRDQKSKVDEQLQRIGENPEAAAILEPLLKKYGLF